MTAVEGEFVGVTVTADNQVGVPSCVTGGQVQLPVDHRVAAPRGMGEVDGDLT
jgi:hypothetical protein